MARSKPEDNLAEDRFGSLRLSSYGGNYPVRDGIYGAGSDWCASYRLGYLVSGLFAYVAIDLPNQLSRPEQLPQLFFPRLLSRTHRILLNPIL